MEIDFLVLADAVEALNNKLYMLGGGWNSVRVAAFPVHHRFGIAGGLVVRNEEHGKRFPIALSIMDPNKQPMIPDVTALVEASAPTSSGKLPIRNVFALNVGLTLSVPGLYIVRLVAGNSKKEAGFEAILGIG